MKKLLLLFITLLIILVGASVSLSINDIIQLKHGFVDVRVNRESGVEYKITSKRPKNWISLEKIPKSAYMAIVISEDWAFFQHEGVDFDQLQIALLQSLQGKKLRGASTITQQLAKNLFTNSDRSLTRKFKELIITKILERNLSKRKILEIYLNVIEYGRDIYGIGPATQFYFGKNARYLSVKEGAFLAMLLPSPVRYSQSFYNKELTVFASEAIEKILRKLVMARVISEDHFLELLFTPLYFRDNN